DLFVPTELALEVSGGIKDAGTLEARERRKIQFAIPHTGCDNDGTGLQDLTVGQMQAIRSLAAVHARGGAADGHFGAELLGLIERATGKRLPRDPGWETEIVFDVRAGPGLPARCRALEHQHVQPLGR